MRINVIGTSGSGKTTFGRQLAEILGIPCLEMDAIFWGPDWYFPPDEKFLPRLSKILEEEHWVLDGNYTRTLGIKWSRVDAVIWLDYSFPRTLYQAITRAISRLINQEELWPGTGNRENLKMLFSRDSIVLWTIRTYWKNRRRNIGWLELEEYNHIQFHQLKSPAETSILLERIKSEPDFLLMDQSI